MADIQVAKIMRKLAQRWVQEYRAADATTRAEMIEWTQSIYWGMDRIVDLASAAEQGGEPLDSVYEVVRCDSRGTRGAYVCRHPDTGDMYVTRWNDDEDPCDIGFSELGVDTPDKESD